MSLNTSNDPHRLVPCRLVLITAIKTHTNKKANAATTKPSRNIPIAKPTAAPESRPVMGAVAGVVVGVVLGVVVGVVAGVVVGVVAEPVEINNGRTFCPKPMSTTNGMPLPPVKLRIMRSTNIWAVNLQETSAAGMVLVMRRENRTRSEV